MTRLTIVATAILAVGCSERDTGDLAPPEANTDPVVFEDNFGDAVDFQAFLGSRLDALSIDASTAFSGTSSLRAYVPGPDELDNGTFAGGAFTTGALRDLSGYNALTFWARSSVATTLNVAGIANDNTGESRYTAEISNVPLTTSWSKVTIPIPLPEKLSAEGGLFYFAEGHEGAPHEVWFDDVRFETVSGITDPTPSMMDQTLDGFVGADISPTGTQTSFMFDGAERVVSHLPGYFTFSSSDEAVATTGDADGNIVVVGTGTATITATLNDIPVSGEVTVSAIQPPSTAAPVPTAAPVDVVSVFSDSYSNVGVDTWVAFGQANERDLDVDGNVYKAFTGLTFTGVALTTPIDVSAFTTVHIDVWLPEPNAFKLKLVDFGADGEFGGSGPDGDVEHELTFTVSSSPPLALGAWTSLAIDFDDFFNLVRRENLAQIILSSTPQGTIFIDNVYFSR